MFRFFRREHDNGATYVPEDFAAKKVRRARVFLFYGLVSAFFLFTAAGWLVFRSPFFRISEIEVTGNKSVTRNAILSLALSGVIGHDYLRAVLGTDHYLNWGDEILSDKLRLVPELKSAKVSKDFKSRKVVISVEERDPRGIWCLRPRMNADVINATLINADTNKNIRENPRLDPRESAGTKCHWFDEGGVLFKPAPFAQGSLINTVSDYSENNTVLGKPALGENFIGNLFSVFDVLRKSAVAVKEIKLKDLKLEEVEVLTFDGPKIYFSLRFPSENVAAVLGSLMSKSAFRELDYVDFRVENRAHYK